MAVVAPVSSDRARAVPCANLRVGSMTNPIRMCLLLVAVLAVVDIRSAFSQTNLLYAWTNFVGEPGFEEAVLWSIGVRNAGSIDGIGRAARFYEPRGVAADEAGNLFVADTLNHKVRKVTPDGLVTMLAGGPGARGTNDDWAGGVLVIGPDGRRVDAPGVSGTADGQGRVARFSRPASVAVDHTGNVFVADTMNNTIRKVTAVGMVTTFAGNSDVWPPRTLEDGPTALRSFRLQGVERRFRGREFALHHADDGVGSAAQFNDPEGVTVDQAGNLFVADTCNQTIRKITPSGLATTLAGKPASIGSADGTTSAARFNFPAGVAVDRAGNVFVADSGNHTIRKVTQSGLVTTLAGKAGTAGTNDGIGPSARFYAPSGVAVDRAGNLFVADSGNSTIRKVTLAGVVTTIGGVPGVTGWDDGIGTSAQFCGPCGIAVDGAGCLYVSDSGNNRITKGTPVQP